MHQKRFPALILAIGMAVTGFLPAHALEIEGGYWRFGLNSGIQSIGTITLRMNNNEYALIKQHGVRLILVQEQRVLWERTVTTLTASGSAVDRGKIAAEAAVSYSSDLKTMNIPLLANWDIGDEATLEGFKVRIYDRGSSPQAIGIDVNGDGVKDLDTPITIKIDDTDERTDRTAPYPPVNFTSVVRQGPWRVELTWADPIDYDWKAFDLERTVERIGDAESLLSLTGATDYTDANVQAGDTITYHVYAKDQKQNRSEPATVSVTIAPQAPEPGSNGTFTVTGGETGQGQSTEALTAEERDLLTRLLNYYGIRYSIKCLPSGVPVQKGDSACLWAKIDLLYAQEQLEEPESIEFSVRELALISQRLQYSQDRYQRYCFGSFTPAPYCTALGRAIKRAEYFLNQSP